MTRLLTIDRLSIVSSADGARILHDVTLSVDPGEIVALIGESGAGKTTLAISALGYVRPGMRVTQGQVALSGVRILRPGLANSELRGDRVSYVAQSAAASFNPALRLKTQVAEPLIIHRSFKPKAAFIRAIDLFEELQLPSPSELAERYPHQVSGGQLQRAMTAMAVIATPELIVFDEPTTALDVTTQVEVLLTIRNLLRDKKCAAIYVTHDLAVVAQVADRCFVMKSGEVVEHGTMDAILTSPAKPYTRQLLDARQQAKQRHGEPYRDKSSLSCGQSDLVLTAVGLAAGYHYRPVPHLPFSRVRTVLHGIDISVARGEVVAVVGESGSGKSTLARAIAGLHEPAAGSVTLEGQPLAGDVANRATDDLRRIQIIFQSPDKSLNPRSTVASTLARPLKRFFTMSGADRRARMLELLDMVGLDPEYLRRPVTALSGGQKQRVSLARALAADPDYLICDEILSALDTIIAHAMLALMRKLQRARAFGCLFISHDLELVRGFADRVVVLYAGRICEEGPASLVLTDPRHPYTRLLLSSVPELRTGWLDGSRRVQSSTLKGDMTGDAEMPGCPFQSRCPVNLGDTCRNPVPVRETDDGRRKVVCHREVASGGGSG